MKVETTIHFLKRGKGKQKVAVVGQMKADRPLGRIPRIARLMALAIRFEELLRTGQVQSYAELARLGHVTPARVTQIMNLNLLAPTIQERLLFLPRTTEPERLHLKDLQTVARERRWERQEQVTHY
jgi:hypothetical protein